MSDHMTPKAQLLDLKMRAAGSPGLVDAIFKMRSEGRSYRQIAPEVSEQAGERISYESICAWAAEWGVEDRVASLSRAEEVAS